MTNCSASFAFLLLTACVNQTAGVAYPAATMTPTGVRVVDRRAEYVITAHSLHQANVQMEKFGPLDNDSTQRFPADSKAYSAWRVLGEQCVPSTASVELDVVITAPLLSANSTLSSAAIVEWNRWRQATLTHEMGHRSISIAAAERLLGGLRAIPNTHDCAQYRQSAAAIVAAVNAEEQPAIKRLTYRRTTGRGRVPH